MSSSPALKRESPEREAVASSPGRAQNYNRTKSEEKPDQQSRRLPNRNNEDVEELDEDDDEEEEEYDDEDDEDEEDEEEEEEEDSDRGDQRRKRRRRAGVSRFVDVEAVVDDDDEEYDEDDEDLKEDGFIEQDIGAEDEGVQRRTVAADNEMLDRQRRREEEMDAHQIAAQLRERYRTQQRLTAQSDYAEVPTRMLMPSVNDPGLYAVRCRPGRERAVIQTILRKAFNPGTSGPLKIISAFCRDSLPGRIYVEANEPKHVIDACNDVAGAYARDNTLFLVPINEMADLLKIEKIKKELKVGGWVRFKTGKHQGDLAQVIDTTENGEMVGLRFVPRLDLDPRDNDIIVDSMGRKRKKGGGRTIADRPPPRFFNAEEVRKKFINESVRQEGKAFVFRNQTYIKGYCEDDIPARRLITEDVNPTLDEISRFAGESINSVGGGGPSDVDLNLLADATQTKLNIVLRKDDLIEVFEGEQAGVEGVIDTVEADVVTIKVAFSDLEDQTIEVPIQSVRKKFRPGDHIKVITGKHQDETGLVVKVEGNFTTFLSDLSMNEVSVFSKDIHEAAEVGSGVNTIAGYELHNLVQLDAQTAGVIFKIEREMFVLLDQANHVRTVRPHQITMKRDSTHAVAVDSEGGEFRAGDTMKEIEGDEREGIVLHIYQATLVWLFNRDLKDNGGVFLTRARHVRPRAPRGVVKTDLSKQNPALAQGLGAGQNGQHKMIGGALSNMRRPGGRDPLAGKTVAIIKGPYKTYRGIIKDTNGPTARVELHSMPKTLTIGLDSLVEKDPITGKSKSLMQRNSFAPSPGAQSASVGGGYGSAASNPYINGGSTNTGANGGATPGYGMSSRTPAHNPYVSGGKTPAYNSGGGGKTPAYNPYVDGGKTPAYNPYADGGKTPAYNPYVDGGKTPAYNPYVDASGSKTPSYRASGDGGRTPAYNPYANGGSGSMSSSNGPAMGPPVARRPAVDPWSAPTPMGAPTPGGEMSAPTPGAYAAPTPGATTGGGTYMGAPTPGGPSYGAPTPGAMGAPTPAGGMLGAPTPAAYGQTPFTPAAQPRAYGGANDGVPQEVPLLADIMVRIIRSPLSGQSLSNGRYDGQRGYIKSISDGGSRAAVVLDRSAGPGGEALNDVAREYIEPLRPDTIRAMCIALTGEHRGKRVIVQSLDGEQVLVGVDGRSAFLDVVHLALSA